MRSAKWVSKFYGGTEQAWTAIIASGMALTAARPDASSRQTVTGKASDRLMEPPSTPASCSVSGLRLQGVAPCVRPTGPCCWSVQTPDTRSWAS